MLFPILLVVLWNQIASMCDCHIHSLKATWLLTWHFFSQSDSAQPQSAIGSFANVRYTNLGFTYLMTSCFILRESAQYPLTSNCNSYRYSSYAECKQKHHISYLLTYTNVQFSKTNKLNLGMYVFVLSSCPQKIGRSIYRNCTKLTVPVWDGFGEHAFMNLNLNLIVDGPGSSSAFDVHIVPIWVQSRLETVHWGCVDNMTTKSLFSGKRSPKVQNSALSNFCPRRGLAIFCTEIRFICVCSSIMCVGAVRGIVSTPYHQKNDAEFPA